MESDTSNITGPQSIIITIHLQLYFQHVFEIKPK